MNTLRGIRLVLAVAVVLKAAPALGQAGYESPKGHVEVLGLRRWTLSMLRDSVRRYVPGQELHDAACMVTLRDSLHFADASVTWFILTPPGSKTRSVLSIKVIEPDQAWRVQWNPRPGDDFTSLIPDYAPVVLPITDSGGAVWPGRFQFWLQFPDSGARQAALTRAPATDRLDGERLFAFLAARQGTEDRRRAMRALRGDGFWVNRMVAAAVLSNFAANDSTWWSLVRALRDPHEAVRVAALEGLSSMPSRSVDWRPVASDLRVLVGGTNLLAMDEVFHLLGRTNISADLAPALLRGNAEWVLEHLGSRTPTAPERAHRLLVQLNRGKDLGRPPAAWAAWAAAL